jgi:ATP-binding protein involved in chromosome partitioning
LTMAQTIPVTGIIIVTTPQDVAMNVAVKAVGMFSKLNVPIVGVIENMSYLQCPHCSEKINIFGKGGGQKISEKFNIPFLGEIPLSPQIMEGSDKGKPIILSEPDSIQANALRKVAKVTAGRISVIAAALNSKEVQADEQTSVSTSISTAHKNGHYT